MYPNEHAEGFWITYYVQLDSVQDHWNKFILTICGTVCCMSDSFILQISQTADKGSLINSHRRWYKDNGIASDEEERNGAPSGFEDLLVGLLIDLHGRDRLFCIREDHVQVLIECLKCREV